MTNKVNSYKFAVSFVHGYENLALSIPCERPALWVHDREYEAVYSYYFPRNPDEFNQIDGFTGQPPMTGAESFKTLPRFGFTGLSNHKDHLYAGSWNGVYEIDSSTMEFKRFITNNMMNDIHGLNVDEMGIWTALTCRDTLVLTDFEGNVQKTWTIDNDLSVKSYDGPDTDWRFVSKQFRGSCGFFHFNYVQRFGDEIWLTSRSCNAFITFNIKTGETAQLRMMNLCTPALLHDGKKVGDKYYFTSIDGKIIIAEDAVQSKRTLRENVDKLDLYRRDLVADIIRLSETDYGREPNWCRGIERTGDTTYVTVDGRYDSDLSFGLVGVDDSGAVRMEKRLRWADVGDESELRYVTGFDVQQIS